MRAPVLIFVFFFLVFAGFLTAQTKDNITNGNDSVANERLKRKKLYSGPRKASILSAILPGAGQVYNKKYWKVPIIYAALGGFGYMFYYNNGEYNSYRGKLRQLVNDPTLTVVDGYDQRQLQTQKLYYRKYRDFAMIGLGVVYLLNIVDANVDAHLRTFDVSDDLSINVNPWLPNFNAGYGFTGGAGVSVKINFK